MSDVILVTGMILSSAPVGESDRRLVILTREGGKISAFARGARKPNSPLVGSTRPFAYGQIKLYEGRSSYTVASMDIQNYFEEAATDLESSFYGTYFMEFADYYTREGMESGEMLKLLYAALLALSKPALPNRLVRAVFELRAMVINGDYSEQPLHEVCESAGYAWSYCITTPIESLFRFTLNEEGLQDFIREVAALKDYYIDRPFKSLEILDTIV